MKIKFLCLTLLSTLFLTDVFAYEDIRSNHSYRNMGFTQVPTVSMSGYMYASAVRTKQSKLYSNAVIQNAASYDNNGDFTFKNIKNHFDRDVIFDTDAAILFKVNGINDLGFMYGAVFELVANSDESTNIDKSYLYLENMYGKFEFGSEAGASKKMKVDAGTIARGTGGIMGKYISHINLPSIRKNTTTQIYTPLYILRPELPTSHSGYGIGFNNYLFACDKDLSGKIDTAEEKSCLSNLDEKYSVSFSSMESAVKLSYYTPQIYGFQFGISYTPDTGNFGTASTLSTSFDTGNLEDVIEAGVSYNASLYGINLSLALTGEKGKSEHKIYNSVTSKFIEQRNDLEAYQVGGVLSYYGLSVAGSYGTWKDSLEIKTNTSSNGSKKSKDNNSTYYTFGTGYEFEGFNLSYTFFKSKFQGINEYKANSFSLDYKIASGFTPYIEYTRFEFSSSDKTFKESFEFNKGYVIMTGFILNF